MKHYATNKALSVAYTNALRQFKDNPNAPQQQEHAE